MTLTNYQSSPGPQFPMNGDNNRSIIHGDVVEQFKQHTAVPNKQPLVTDLSYHHCYCTWASNPWLLILVSHSQDHTSESESTIQCSSMKTKSPILPVLTYPHSQGTCSSLPWSVSPLSFLNSVDHTIDHPTHPTTPLPPPSILCNGSPFATPMGINTTTHFPMPKH